MLMISEQVLAQWRRLVAFRKALDLLHQAIYTKVPAHRVGCLLSPWLPPRQYGVSSRPMKASSGLFGVALDILYQAMQRQLLRCMNFIIDHNRS